MSNVIAISAVMTMCMVGQIDVHKKCTDGSEALSVTLNILTGTAPEGCLTYLKWHDLTSCINHWDSILELDKGGEALFILYPDGHTKTAAGFNPDQAADAFFRAIAEQGKSFGLTK